MNRKQFIQLVVSIVSLVLIAALYAALGALKLGIVGLILGAGLFIVGFVGMGTAQAIVLISAAIGAILGVVIGMLQLAGAAATIA